MCDREMVALLIWLKLLVVHVLIKATQLYTHHEFSPEHFNASMCTNKNFNYIFIHTTNKVSNIPHKNPSKGLRFISD